MANNQAGYDLRNQIYGGSPQDYAGVFKNAYTNLNQPGQGHEAVTAGGTQDLADAFIQRVYEKTGKLPDEGQIRDFVSGNLNSRYASDYITGGTNADTIKSQLVDPYLSANGSKFQGPTDTSGEALQAEVAKRTQADLQTRLESLYGQAQNSTASKINSMYDVQRGKTIDEEAAAGRLRSPASIPNINRVDAARNNDLGNAAATIAGQQATGQLDVSKTIENMLAGERRAGENVNQNNITNLLNNQKFKESQSQYDTGVGLQREQNNLAAQLGKAQAGAGGKDWMDYLNTGIGLAGVVTAPFTGGSSMGGASLLSNAINAFRQPKTAGVNGVVTR